MQTTQGSGIMEDKYQNLDFRAYVVYFLKNLKLLLLSMLIGLVLFGGFRFALNTIQYFRDYSEVSESEDESKDVEKRINMVAANIEFNEKLIYELEDYINNSIAYNMSPSSAVYTYRMIYIENDDKAEIPTDYIIIEAPDRKEEIVMNAYKNIGITEELVSRLNDELNLDLSRKLYEELITIDVVTASNSIRIKTLFENIDISQKMCSIVYDNLYKQVSDKIFEHNTTILYEYSNIELDEKILSDRETINKKYDDLIVENELLSEEYENLLVLQSQGMQSDDSNIGRILGILFNNVLKLALMGGLIFLSCVILYLFFVDAVSLKVDSYRSLKNNYNLPVLGVISSKDVNIDDEGDNKNEK